jgi:hypothetical protein
MRESLASTRMIVPKNFASFGEVWPNANTGVDWQIFNDNKFLNRSSIWYETVPNPEVDGDHVLRLHFSLDRGHRSLADDAYSGIFIDLNPPLRSANLSRYSGLRFRARRHEDSPLSPLRYYVSLANPQITKYAYHEYEFTDRLRNDGRFTVVNVSFSRLHQPRWATTNPGRRFDESNVYRLSFFVKGDGGMGYFDLDEIAFVDSQPR